MRVTQEHWQVFLQLAEENPGLISNKFNGAQGKAEGNALWQTIANKLNSLGYGQKTVAEWRKTVTDWKSKVKAKASKLRSEACQTGGGSLVTNNLTPLEEKLLSLMGTKCLEGDSGISELGLPTSVNTNYVSVAPGSSSAATTEEIGPLNEEQDVLADHQYTTPARKRKPTMPVHTSTNVTKKRRVNSSRLSRELYELTEESVSILRNIDSNLSKMADSFNELVNIFKSRNS